MNNGSVIIDCERMKYPHTGLYQFCLHLSQSLIKTNPGRPLCFYLPPKAGKVFGNNQCYLRQAPLHKVVFPRTRRAALWHCTHQGSDYFPFGRKLKKVLTVHDLNYLHDPRKTGAKREKFLSDLQRKIDAADYIAFISQFSQRDTAAHLQLNDKPTSVVYNGCTVCELPSLAPPPFVPDRPFLFTLGTITDKKNFHVLPALLQGNDFLLVVSGLTHSEAYKERIVQEAKRFGAESRLVFTGPVGENDKQWYLKHCAAFVFPSLAEGFGLPVIEAMYFGKPVLLSQATSLPEVGGDVAYYFPCFDAAQMQATLTESLHDFEIHPQKAEAARQRALSFSWDEAALAYHQIYTQVLGG